MLSDETVKAFCAEHGFVFGMRERRLIRAVEAEVRADQIEKDAAIAQLPTESQVDVVWDALELGEAGHYTRGNVRAALEAARLTPAQPVQPEVTDARTRAALRWVEAALRGAQESYAEAWDRGYAASSDYVWRCEDAEAAGQGVLIPTPVNPYRGSHDAK